MQSFNLRLKLKKLDEVEENTHIFWRYCRSNNFIAKLFDLVKSKIHPRNVSFISFRLYQNNRNLYLLILSNIVTFLPFSLQYLFHKLEKVMLGNIS